MVRVFIHCTLVITATETSRRVDDGTPHVLRSVPYPLRAQPEQSPLFQVGNQSTRCSPSQTCPPSQSSHHITQSSTKVLNVTTESSTTTPQQKSCPHKLVHSETLRTCVPRCIDSVLLWLRAKTPTHRPDTLTPIRSRFGCFKVQDKVSTATCRSATLRSSVYSATTCIISERQAAHCVENNCADVPVTVFQ